MGTIIGILVLAGVISIAMELFKEGSNTAHESADEGSGCGCLIAIILLLFSLSFFSWAAAAPIGMIVAALIVIAIAKGK